MLLHWRRQVWTASVLPMLTTAVVVIRTVREALIMRYWPMVWMRLLRKGRLLRWELSSWRTGSTLKVAIAMTVVTMVRILITKIARMLLILVLVWWKLLGMHVHGASTLSIISSVRALVLRAYISWRRSPTARINKHPMHVLCNTANRMATLTSKSIPTQWARSTTMTASAVVIEVLIHALVGMLVVVVAVVVEWALVVRA